MSKSQRVKGRRGELATVELFKPLYPDARRNMEDILGNSGVDVFAGPWVIQRKTWKTWAPVSAINEIQLPGLPLLITSADYKETYAVLPLKLLLRILEDVGIAF